MADAVDATIAPLVGGRLVWATAIASDHNHVVREHHGGRACFVHRKGAMPAGHGVAGVVPGSMGTRSVHVEGRGHPESLASSAHGAGRILSRAAARSRITERELRRELAGVWFDVRLAGRLRDEAPTAYKDIHAVFRAQGDLVAVTRVVQPLLTYKGQ